MSSKIILSLFIVFSAGISTSPVHGGDIISCDSFENCPDGSVPLTNALLALEARMDVLEADNEALKADNAVLVGLLAGVSRIIDPNTAQDTLRFTNMNVQLVSGSEDTAGTANGTGNLIIGYNELRGDSSDDRTGSHMLVIGVENSYSQFGGMIVGAHNTTSGQFSSVSAGGNNMASGAFSSVGGGDTNTASGSGTSVSGGFNNLANATYATVSAGFGNQASALYASVSGGQNNVASGQFSSVSGGVSNQANSIISSVSGGQGNIVSGGVSSISGGLSKTAAGDWCVVGDSGLDC